MSLAMNKKEREEFLAGLHVGVISMNRQDAGPLSAPIWYSYEHGLVSVLTNAESRKGKLMQLGDRFTLVAQTEVAPYQYVSVEGVIVLREPSTITDTCQMAIRYLGEEMGNTYAEGSNEEGSLLIKMKPERWLTVDYGKQY